MDESKLSESDVRDATKEVTARFGRPYWVRCVDEKRQPRELLEALGASGLLGLGVPEELGGQGGGLREQVALIHQLGLAGIPSYSFLVANFVRDTLLKYASAEQIATHVPMTMTGKTYTAFALTEQDSGTNAFAMKSRATLVGDEWIIDGRKCFITAAGEASQLMVVARTDSEGSSRSALSLFVTLLPCEGISFHPMRIDAGAPDVQYNVDFDRVRLPRSALVGELGEGTRYLFSALNAERILGAAMAVGLGDFALSKGVEYAKVRSPFGSPIGSYQAVSHLLARARIQLDAALSVLRECVDAHDTAQESSYLASAAKLLASEAANAAVDATIQVHGGWAFDRDLDIITMAETIRLFRVAPINNESVLNLVATSALGLPRSTS